MLERDALTVRLLTPPKGDSAPPELYATVAGLQLCVLPDALHSLYAFISRFSALIAPATPPVRKPPAPREAPPLTSPLPPARLRLSVQGVLVSLPGVRVPTPESVGIVIEVHTELFLDHNKEGLRFELEVRNLIARRSGVMRVRYPLVHSVCRLSRATVGALSDDRTSVQSPRRGGPLARRRRIEGTGRPRRIECVAHLLCASPPYLVRGLVH